MKNNYMYCDVNEGIFRAYDIRGIVPEDINENGFFTIAHAIAIRLKALGRDSIFIGRDGRLSSLALSNALIQGLLISGIDVVDLGEVATPMMYYATCEMNIDSGLMITGSHNPANYNGIKMVLAGHTLANEEVHLLYTLAVKRSFKPADRHGNLKSLDIEAQYIDRIVSDIQLQRPLKVVIDSGNGMASRVAPKLFKRLGCEVIPLYCEIDGRFPNHHPDPTVESNLNDLKHMIAMHQADLGIAFDGDADRLGVVTEKGHLIWPDRLMMMYANQILSDHPGATIVYDVKCSSHLERVIAEGGGCPVMSPTGHSLVKRLMKKNNALLAGEMSGHLFFKHRWYGFDDAIYSAARLLEILSASLQSVDEQFAVIPNSINTPEIKIPIFEDKKFSFMQRFAEEAFFPAGRCIHIDGLRVEFEEGWGLVRASNTTPCLVARFEAQDEASLSKIQSLFKAQLMAIDAELAIPF